MAAPTLAAPLVGLPPAQEAQRRRLMIVGTAFAIGALVMLFGALLGLYFSARADGGEWPPQTVQVPNVPLAVATVTLVMSSVTAQWAPAALRQGDRRHMYMAISITVVLGGAFANALTFAWTRLNATVDSTYGLHMYAVTVPHLVLTAGGVLALIVVGFRALGGQFSPRNASMVQAAVMLWHAVVALWLVIWFCLFFLERAP
jgi:cytochrome c oxidase subunit 3